MRAEIVNQRAQNTTILNKNKEEEEAKISTPQEERTRKDMNKLLLL